MSITKDECERILGERFYGFGSWNAKYWFIGPEQGQGKDENDELTLRCEAFQELEEDGLCDCRDFHLRVGVPAATKWYRANKSGDVPLQQTWRRLMRCLFAYLSDKPFSNRDLRKYQVEQLGQKKSDTCLVELCGLPARSFRVERDRDKYLDSRLDRLMCKLNENPPEFVVIYGKKYQHRWMDKLRSQTLQAGDGGLWHLGRTRIGFIDTPHGQPNYEWDELGRKLRAV